MGSEPELKKVETAVSKHLRILQKIRGGGKSSMVWVNTTSSERIIAYLVCCTCL